MAKYKRLLFALAAFLILMPFTGDIPFSRYIVPGAFVMVLLTAVFDVGKTHALLLIGSIIAAPAVVSQIVVAILPQVSTATHVFSDITNFALLSFVTYRIIRDVISHDVVTADTVRGALCTYLLLGFVWWSAYSLVDSVDPQAFKYPGEIAATEAPGHEHGVSAAAHAEEDEKPQLLYFSFVTLTTLGYGDITPINPKAVSLSLLEAIVGQLFVAVTIARVVGMHSASSQKQ